MQISYDTKRKFDSNSLTIRTNNNIKFLNSSSKFSINDEYSYDDLYFKIDQANKSVINFYEEKFGFGKII